MTKEELSRLRNWLTENGSIIARNVRKARSNTMAKAILERRKVYEIE